MKKLIVFLFMSGGLFGWKSAAYFLLALFCFSLYEKLNPGYGVIEHNAFFLLPVGLIMMAGFSFGITWWEEYGEDEF